MNGQPGSRGEVVGSAFVDSERAGRGRPAEPRAWRHEDGSALLSGIRTRLLPPRAMTSQPTVLVSRRETFNAAHQLRNPRLSDDENRRLFGKCVNLHGHNYALDVVVAGKINDDSGYVMDLKVLSEVMQQQVIQHVDHRNLNTDVPWLQGCVPTAENLAVIFWERLKRELPEGALQSVRVWETDKNWAEVGDHS